MCCSYISRPASIDTDLRNLRFSKPMPRRFHSAFSYCVVSVLFWRSCKNVIRVDARRVIALVAGKLSFFETVKRLANSAVNQHKTATAIFQTANSYLPISLFFRGHLP